MNDSRAPSAVDPCEPLPLADRLRPVVVQLGRQLRKELADLGLTASQVSLLAALRDNPGVSLRELASHEGVSAPAMTGSIDRLEALGLVRRATSTADRRRVEIALSPRGRAVLRTVRSRRTAWLADRLGELTSRERATIEAAIAPLARLLEVRR